MLEDIHDYASPWEGSWHGHGEDPGAERVGGGIWTADGPFCRQGVGSCRKRAVRYAEEDARGAEEECESARSARPPRVTASSNEACARGCKKLIVACTVLHCLYHFVS